MATGLIQQVTSIAANTTVADVFINNVLAFNRRGRSIIDVGIVASATGLLITLFNGTEMLAPEFQPSTANRFPITPDDLIGRWGLFPADRLMLKAQNTTGGALNLFPDGQIHEHRMKGLRNIQHIWDWLGLGGNKSEPYNLVPVVVPVVQLNGVEYPIRPMFYTQTIAAIVLGPNSIILPVPTLPDGVTQDLSVIRVWTYLISTRTNAAAGESFTVRKCGRVIIFNSQDLIPGSPHPLINGMLPGQTAAGVFMQERGLPPQYVYLVSSPSPPLRQAGTISLNYVAAAGSVGSTWTIEGTFIDIPVSAPVPWEWL